MMFTSLSRILSSDLFGDRWYDLLSQLRAGAVLAALLVCTACPKNPSITLSNTPNEVGGTLHISGSGFTGGGKVSFSATNTPGHSAIEPIGGTTAASDGSVSADIPFSWPSPGVLPGCAQGSTSTVTVTITATDNASNSPTFATIDLVNCGMVWSQSPA
jgi:hypothetical protein